MYSFSESSQVKLQQCDPRLQAILNEAIKYIDFTVTCGYRGMEEQERAYALGNTKVRFPKGKHNSMPSAAVDIQPYPNATRENFVYLAGIIMGIAFTMNIPLRWGNDWNENNDTSDNSFDDLYHFELK